MSSREFSSKSTGPKLEAEIRQHYQESKLPAPIIEFRVTAIKQHNPELFEGDGTTEAPEPFTMLSIS